MLQVSRLQRLQGWHEKDWHEPDWRKPESYSYTDGFSNEQWAWEFLRRNPDYRNEWAGWFDPNSPATEAEKKALAEHVGFDSVTDDHVREERAAIAAAKWHLVFPCNPSYPVSNRSPLWRRDSRPWEPIMLAKEATGAGFRRFLRYGLHVQAFALALDRPIDDQIDRLREKISEYLKEHGLDTDRTRGPTQENWPLYLRALDAKAKKASYGQMALSFFESAANKEKGHARDTCTQAEKVRDGGYIKIALRPSKATPLQGQGEGD